MKDAPQHAAAAEPRPAAVFLSFSCVYREAVFSCFVICLNRDVLERDTWMVLLSTPLPHLMQPMQHRSCSGVPQGLQILPAMMQDNQHPVTWTFCVLHQVAVLSWRAVVSGEGVKGSRSVSVGGSD